MPSTALRSLRLAYRSSKGKDSSQDTTASREGDRPLKHSCSYEAKGFWLSSVPLFHLTSSEEKWCYHQHPRVAYKQQAAVYTKGSFHRGCGVRVGVCRVISLLSFLSSPWKVYIYAAWVAGSTLHFSYILFSGRCYVAHYFFSLDWNPPVGRNVMRNLLL